MEIASQPFPFGSITIPSGLPGRCPEGSNYNKVIGKAVRRKWKTPEEKEWWYSKLTLTRRRKTTKLHSKQNGLCVFCQQRSWLLEDDRDGLSKNRMATLEHIVPQSKGGTDHLSNLVMACYGCNNLRGDMKFNKFAKLRSNPEAWKIHCRAVVKRAEPRKKKVKEKRAVRQAEFMWKIAILLYLRPEWNAVVEEIKQEFMRRRAHIEERQALRRSRSPVDLEDIT